MSPFTVIGVVQHLRIRSVVADLTEQVFFSQRQVTRNPIAYVRQDERRSLGVWCRRSASGGERRSPGCPSPMCGRSRTTFAEATARGRFTATLGAVFAVLALILACVGVYGVVAYGRARGAPVSLPCGRCLVRSLDRS